MRRPKMRVRTLMIAVAVAAAGVSAQLVAMAAFLILGTLAVK
jgi:hypothetical protein